MTQMKQIVLDRATNTKIDLDRINGNIAYGFS